MVVYIVLTNDNRNMSSIYVDIGGTHWFIMAIGKGLLATPQARHASWQVLAQASPSGKQMFRCGTCGRESVTPDKYCPIGRTISLTKYLIVEESI